MDGLIQHSDWADSAYSSEETKNDPLLSVRTESKNTSSLMLIGMLDNFQPLPPFGNLVIDRMLLEPKVKLGLRFIKGTISANTQYEVECKNPEIKTFVEGQLDKFMARGMKIALKALHRGYAANEVVYERLPDGRFSFCYLNHIDYRAVTPLHLYGKVVSIRVTPEAVVDDDSQEQIKARAAIKPITLNHMKKLWVVHQRDENTVYGRSQLLGAHIPYHEIASFGGMRDGLSVWFRKNAFDGGIIWAPDGNGKLDGQIVENRLIAQRILDNKRNGGSLVFPSAYDDKGNKLWDYKEPSSGEAAETHLKWFDVMGDQVWEGMEISPDLCRSADAGAGSNVKVLKDAHYDLCTGIATDIIHDFDGQSLRPLVHLNYCRKFNAQDLYYEIKKIKVVSDTDRINQENQMGGSEPEVDPETGEPKKEDNNPYSNGTLSTNKKEKVNGNSKKMFPANNPRFRNNRG